jgi:predicted glutamine amidotransferase
VCELFAMSARVPATVSLSFAEFSRRGGGTAPHADGWGVAFAEGRDARILREPAPAATSACVRFLQSEPVRSTLVLSHVRRATRGAIALENTQPFARELGGRLHLFAHNGDLPRVQDALPLGRARPIGETDSEYAFCGLLARLDPLWANGTPPSRDARLGLLAEIAGTLRDLGPANFLYTDGETLFAHADRRVQPDRTIAPPGLHLLSRHCAREPSAGAGITVIPGAGEQEVALLASVPLTHEAWEPLPRGALLAVEAGAVVARRLL